MDRIEKVLRALTPKQKLAMSLLLEQLKRDHMLVPGLKKLMGKAGYFRVRMGAYRIIFIVHKDKTIEIMRIVKRDENTYKNF